MAKRCPQDPPAVNHVYEFDRLLDSKLHNAYSIMVPQQIYKIPVQPEQRIGDQDEDCRTLCASLKRAAKR